MPFLRCATGYTKEDKIRSEVIRLELEINGIQDVTFKYEQNWINHIERMDNTRLPKHAFNYETRGRRDRGHTSKRWQWFKVWIGQKTQSMEEDDVDDDIQWMWTYCYKIMHIAHQVWEGTEIFIMCYLMHILEDSLNWYSHNRNEYQEHFLG